MHRRWSDGNGGGRPLCAVPALRMLVTLAVATGSVAGCRRSAPAAATPAMVTGSNGQVTIPEGSALRSELSFDTTRALPISTTITATASVETVPDRTVRLFPPMTGRVIGVHVQSGDAVHRGDPLITLDAPDFTSAQADLSHAAAAYRQAKNNLARERDLATYGIAATRDVEQAETDFTQAEGDLHRAVARLTLLGIDTSAARTDLALIIRSPIDGRVTDVSVGVGQFYNDPTVPVMTVADLATVWLSANVSEKDVHAVRAGDRASAVLAAYPNDTLHGVVAQVGAVVDTGTRMTQVRVTFRNAADRLKPGMYGTVTFAGRPVPTIVVPATSLLQIRDSSYVFVETAPWTLERRPVAIGPLLDGRAVVREGLTAGQRIVVRQVVLLQ